MINFQVADNANATVKCFGIGTIQEVSPQTLQIDAQDGLGHAMNGKFFGCTISLQEADSFVLWDWRNIPPEEKSMKEGLQDTFDTVLTIAVGAATCMLFSMKRSDEL